MFMRKGTTNGFRYSPRLFLAPGTPVEIVIPIRGVFYATKGKNVARRLAKANHAPGFWRIKDARQ